MSIVPKLRAPGSLEVPVGREFLEGHLSCGVVDEEQILLGTLPRIALVLGVSRARPLLTTNYPRYWNFNQRLQTGTSRTSSYTIL